MQIPNLITPDFRALSARLGQDPLQVQGPGGNTSIKKGSVMYIKASGTELADAETADIFVAVDRDAAVLEAQERAGDGSCKDTVLDTSHGLRPSIETTFHAALAQRVVAHTHSVATLAHVISPEGRGAAAVKLAGLNFVMVPYAKPGLPLTRQILARVEPKTNVILLQNHGLICAGDTVEEVASLIAEVEERLALDARSTDAAPVTQAPPEGFVWSDYGWLAQNTAAFERARSGTYYPDHVVFLGPCLPVQDHDGNPPAILQEGQGVLIKADATSSQLAMLQCLSDVLARVQDGWSVEPIGPDAEAALLNWDAEKYRQALAARA
ncbi:class II aldolase/adducin family protein [Phaeobacter sp. JH20_39]|uniref:class II aldolase/adducin family protein n=1 Tax=Phaeobacter sp. JH20_39 TaxID=3112496 RepID=UPI003A84CDA0